MNPIKSAKKVLTEFRKDLGDNVSKGIGFALIGLLVYIAAKDKFSTGLSGYYEHYIKEQSNYSQAIESNPNMKREFDLMLQDDLSALRSIYRTSLNEAQYDAIAYYCRELKMSPFRFIKFLEKTDIPYFDKGVFSVLKELKQATSLANLRVVEKALFEKEYERRGNLAYRKDLSKELQYRLKIMQDSQNNFLLKFNARKSFDAFEQRKILDKVKRELRERSLPRGSQGRINKPRSNLRA